ncbi:MAG: sensor histidine kinase [Geminicoccaceae bacterium]
MKTDTDIVGFSHDIRNMLATIRLLAEQIEQRGETDVRHLARRVARMTDTCTAFCNRTIELKRERSPSERTDKIEMRAFLGEIAEQLDPGQVRNFTVQVDCPPYLVANLCSVRLHRVLFNILHNSADALSGQQNGEISVRAERRGRNLVIEVEDSGPGFDHESVLDGWTIPRADRGEDERIRGIGLPTAFALMREMGGRLTLARSGPGGTVFRLTVPNCLFDVVPGQNARVSTQAAPARVRSTATAYR